MRSLDDCTAPEDIGLIVGFPQTREEFARQIIETPMHHDYAWVQSVDQRRSEYNRAPGDVDDIEDFASRLSESRGAIAVAKAITELKEVADGIGVQVAREHDLNSAISDLAATKRTLVFFAHWRDHIVAPHQWLFRFRSGDQIALHGRLKTLTAGLRALDGAFMPVADEIDKEIEGVTDPKRLSSLLNRLITSDDPLYDRNGNEIAERIDSAAMNTTRFFHYARNREMLDGVLQDMFLAPGNRLELSDGLHSRDEISNAINDKVDGIGLVACNSFILQETLNKSCRRTLATTDKLPVVAWAMVLSGALRRTARTGESILLTPSIVRVELKNEINRLREKRHVI